MDIILDTNIFIQDFLMNSIMFSLLFDYLKKTNSKIMMPQIVWEELAEKCRLNLTERLKNYKRAKKTLEAALTGGSIPDFDLDVSDEVRNYVEFVKAKLGISDSDIVAYKNDYLPEIVHRAITRMKPISDKGEEFRDALLWLTILDIARGAKQHAVAFISNDPKAFGREHSLHNVLLKEAEEKGVTIKYYNSIDKFIKSHAVRIEYITREWLTNVISHDVIKQHMAHRLESYLANLDEYDLERRGWGGLEFTGYINLNCSEPNLGDFYIYEKYDDSIYAIATYYLEIEVEFIFEKKIKREIGLPYPWEDFEDYDIDYETETETKYKYPEAEIVFGISIKDREVIDIEVVDWYI